MDGFEYAACHVLGVSVSVYCCSLVYCTIKRRGLGSRHKPFASLQQRGFNRTIGGMFCPVAGSDSHLLLRDPFPKHVGS